MMPVASRLCDTARNVQDPRRIMNGSSPTFPARLSSWPFPISRNARPTNAFADIFGPRAVLVAGVSTNGGRTSTTLMPTPANCRRSAMAKE